MTTYILVPGAWHGGWWWQPVVDRLAQAGHRAVAVTPAGLGADESLTDRAINLDTHVQQVLDLAGQAGEGVVLVGHSYGGSVINQVADAMPAGQVAALVHLDTDLLENGESCFTFTTQANRDYFLEAITPDGLGVAPLPFFDDRARPHPLATLLQPAHLTGAWKGVPVKHFVAALETPGGLQAPESMRRVKGDPAWRYQEWPVRHNMLAEGPDRVVELLLQL